MIRISVVVVAAAVAVVVVAFFSLFISFSFFNKTLSDLVYRGHMFRPTNLHGYFHTTSGPSQVPCPPDRRQAGPP